MMKFTKAVLLFFVVCAGLPARGQAVNQAQQLAFAGLRSAQGNGQINGVQTDAVGNLYFVIDQKDGVRVLKTDNTATTILAQAQLGAAGDIGVALALDPAGNIYVTGTTTSSAFSSTSGAAIPNRTDSSTQSFVAKFDTSLATVFVSYTGGSRIAATALAATADSVFVTGLTYASNLPVTANGIQQAPAYGSSQNGFVERFNAAGTNLTYATYLTGASGDTTPAAIVADSSDAAYIAGFTSASGYPTVAALVPAILSVPSGFLTKLAPAGDAITFSTFIPGAGLTSLALDAAGSTLLATGSVALGQFPVDTVAEPLVALTYQVLLRLPLDGSGVQSGVLLAPGTQSQVAAAAGGAVWVDGVFSYPQLPLQALADEGSGYALRVTSTGTIDQTARFGGGPTTNPAFASLPLTLTSIAVDATGEPLLAGALQPTASSSLLATETYDLPLRPTGVFASTVKASETTAAACQGSLCAGSAAYLAKLTPTTGAALTLAGDDLPYVTVRNPGSSAATAVQFATTAGNVTSDCPSTLPAGGVCSLLLRGGASGTLTATAANGTPQTLAFAAYTAPANTVHFHPLELDFGIVSAAGAAATQTLTVTNLGTVTQTFTSAPASSPTQFTESGTDCGSPKTLAPGGVCHITLSFAASSNAASDGPASGNWTVAGRNVALTAYGQAAALAVSAAEVDFGTQYVNGLQLPRYLYLSNNSTQPLAHAAVSLPASTSFTLTDACPATLLPASVCRIRIDYNDLKAPASDSATLTLDQGLSVLLTGSTLPQKTATGTTVNPNLTVTPASVTFASPVVVTGVSGNPQTVSIGNAGSAPFDLSLALTGDFTDTTSCPATLAGGATCAVAISFVPGAPGTRSGLLAVTAGAGSSPAYVALSGTGTAILAANNGVLDAGSVPLDQPSVRFYQVAVPFSSLTATATGPYTIALAPVSNSGYSTPPANAFAASVKGACPNCYLAVRFEPTAPGAQTGSLTLSSAAAGTPYVLSLTGTGLPVTGLLLTPGRQDFGAVAFHSTSDAMLFTLTNASATGQPVSVTGPVLSGDFAQTTTATGAQGCSGSLAFGASCQVGVAFSPAATGTRTGSLSFSSGSLSATASLTGTGTADPGVGLNPTSLTFANVPGTTSTTRQVNVTNTGTAVLTIGTPATASPFAATSSCGTLAPAAGCTVTVTYTPGGAVAAGSLALPVTSGGMTTSYLVPLTGSYTSASAGLAIVPAASTFGPAAVLTPGATRVLTVNNLTAKQVNLNIDLPRQFMLSGAPCTTLAANGSCSFTVMFLPLTNGEAAGTVTAQATPADGSGAFSGIAYLEAYGAGSGVLAVSGALVTGGAYSFGQVASGQSASQPFTLTNSGTGPLTIRRVSSAPPFLAATTCGTTLAQAQSCTVTVTYRATNQVASGSTSPATTADAGSLTIESDASSSPDVIALSGQAGPATASNPTNAVPLATYTLSQNSLVFASTAVGNVSPSQSVTLTNTGSVTLHLLSLFATGDFSATSNCAAVPAGAACTLNVVANPQTAGTKVTSLEILSDSTVALEYVSLFGIATPAQLSFSPTMLDFGSITVGASARLPVQVTNNGSTAVTLTGISASGDYSAGGTCPAAGGTLAAGQGCTVQVTFAPGATGTRAGTLSVASSASAQPLTVALTGAGTQSRLLVTPASLAFGNVVTGIASNLSLTLANTGTAPVTGIALAASGDYSVSVPCAVATLAPGSSCAVQITFLPGALGLRNGTLTVTSSDPSSPLAVPLTGTGIAAGAFTLTVNGGASASASIASGHPATYALAVTPTGGFAGAVALTCTAVNPAQYASCSITPSAITLNGAPVSANVTINTITEISALADPLPWRHPGLFVCLLLPVAFCARRRRLPALLLTLCALAVAGCGGTGADPNARYSPVGTYLYTVTASSTSGVQLTQAVTLNLTVTPR